MNTELILIGLFGLMTLAIDGLLWGLLGYVVFKLLRIRDKYWVIGAILTGVIYFLWNDIVMKVIMKKLQLQINNESVSDVVGNSIYSLDFSDVIISFVVVFLGFMAGKRIIKALFSRITIKGSHEPTGVI
jgi:hypothetical protein